MNKYMHILLGTVLLLTVTFSRVPVYKCNLTGSLCLDKACCVKVDDSTESDSCCETSCCSDEQQDQQSSKSINDQKCCVEFDIDHEAFDDLQTAAAEKFSGATFFYGFDEFIDSLETTDDHASRAPPLTNNHFPNSPPEPIYTVNCPSSAKIDN